MEIRMPKGYKHLTYEQRCQIPALLKRKIPRGVIANDLGIHRSTLTRELNRNSGLRGYRHKQAQRKSNEATPANPPGLGDCAPSPGTSILLCAIAAPTGRTSSSTGQSSDQATAQSANRRVRETGRGTSSKQERAVNSPSDEKSRKVTLT